MYWLSGLIYIACTSQKSALPIMNSRRRFRFLTALGLLAALWLAGCQSQHASHSPAPPLAHYTAELRQARARQPQAARYCSQFGIVVDLTRPDTENRFFLLDLRTARALVAAPCLNGRTDRQGHVRYSNAVDSNCSSRGLAWTSYAEAYPGRFGIAYRLHGLSASTSNLAVRTVVLHSWRRVPAAPVASGQHPVQSWGCPALAPARLAEVASYLRGVAGRRVLVCLR
jgi:hypothetical protein